MADQFDYRELTGSRSSWNAGFSMNGGRSVRKQYVTSSNLYAMCKEILGAAEPHNDGSRIHRILPKADPQFPWLFASAITNIEGVGGRNVTQTASDPARILEAPAFDDYAAWPGYILTVEFTPRNYCLLGDDSLFGESITNYPNSSAAGTAYTVYDEWRRFVSVEYLPNTEYVTAQQGQFVIDVANGKQPNARGMGQGIVKMLERKVNLKIKWHQVPYSYITATDSYILAGVGLVNQSTFMGFAAGSLLYLYPTVTVYTPVVPENTAVEYQNNGKIAYAPQRLCDVEFNIQYFNPTLGKDVDGNAATPGAGPNLAVIQAGHNLKPNGPLQSYYYVKTANQSVPTLNDQPVYGSYSFQLLFKQPTV